MRVVARGWKRDCGENLLMSVDLEDGLTPYESVGVFKPGVAYQRNRANGDVEILLGPNTLTLGGKYQTIASFSPDDTLRLFVAAHRNKPFGEVIKALSEAVEKGE